MAFILATAAGTLLHEAGHYVVAKSFGFRASIHFASTHYDDLGPFDSIYVIESQYRKQIADGTFFPEKEKYDHLLRKYREARLLTSMGGPLQTMLTGTISLLLLFAWKKSFKERQELLPWQWLLIFTSLFWLRQAANMVVWLCVLLFRNRIMLSGDEIEIAHRLHLPFWSVFTLTGLTGLIVLAIVTFRFIPRGQRRTFVWAGIAGGVAGYVLWLYLLGPVLLP